MLTEKSLRFIPRFMDKLDHMFQQQENLSRRIGVEQKNLDEQGQIQWILNYTRALQQETAELVDTVPWKWWKKHQTFDHDAAKVELIDIFHFVIALAQVLGLSADDFYAIYNEKNKINHQRQEENY